MKQLQPVIWTKGTFLTPQHLQVQDRYTEDILKFRLQTLKFCPWGFKELLINREMLAGGQLVISRASGIFPDGLLFDIPDADPPPPSKALAELFDPDAKSLDVYLSIPDFRPRGVNVALNVGGGSRYVVQDLTVRDDNTGMGEKPLQIARKNFQLLAESENREGSSTLRVANIERTPAGTFRLNPRFIPPLIAIAGSDYLVGILRGLLEIMSAKSTQLSGSRRQRNQSLADFTAADIANFWLLYTVNSHFPLFSHFYEEKTCHPEELFSAMISLAGSLTTFSTKLRPRDLPTYVHDSLGPVFTQLDEALRSMLETVVPTNLVSLPLTLVKNAVYATAIDQDKYLDNTRMYLAVAADRSEATIIQKVPQLVKVGSANQIDSLINQALSGLRLTHVPKPPTEVPVKLKYQYFSLNQSGSAWESIRKSRNLAAYVPSDLPNPNLELLILMPRKQ
jgi:type VI secretion system protein ImpJ